MDSTSVKVIKLFYCYAREDKLLRDELEKHLSLMRRRGVISAWYDQEILPGEEWKQTIDANLKAADIVLLLVSPDFMSSDYCYSVEMQRALERHARGEISIVPIILRPVDWEDAPFSHLRVLPTDGKPVVSSFWHTRDEAFANIVNNLRRLINTLGSKTTVSSEVEPQVVSVVANSNMSRVEKLLATGDVFLRRNDYDEALVAYEEVIKQAQNEVRAYKKKSEVLFLLNRYIEIVKLLEQSEQLFPDDNDFRKSKGRALCELRLYEEALVVYRQALRVDFNDADAYAGKGRALAGLKRDAEALTAYEQALQLAPDHIEASIGKGSALRNLNQLIKALAYYEHFEQLASGDARFYTGKAGVFWDLKRYEDALIAYDKALQIDSNNMSILYSKARLLTYPLEREKEGLSLYNKIIEIEPTNANDYVTLGNTLSELNCYEEALAAYKQAIQIDPSNADHYIKLGEILYRLERHEEALTAYKQAIQIDPSNAHRYIELGELFYQLNRHKEALATYERAIQADPDNARAYFIKGLRLDYDRAEEALAAFSEAARLNPEYALYQKCRGDTLVTLKQYSEALFAYERAMKLASDDTTSHRYRSAQGGKQEVLRLMEQAEKG